MRLIINTLQAAGLSARHFICQETVETIQRLCDKGATAGIFCSAYFLSSKASNNFGMNHLKKNSK